MDKKESHALPLRDIHIDDTYWNRYIRLVPDVIIPYQWEVLNDRVPDAAPSHCIQNFKIAAGEAQGERQGTVFQDTDVGKWLEAVAYSLESHPDPQLEATADAVIELIGRAQCPDGYLDTYYTLVEGGRRWQNLSMGHELYTAGHLIEAAVAYQHATGKDRFLQIMCKCADLICQTFGPGEGQLHGEPGHPEIELALMRLYRSTGNRAYLDTAKYFVDHRGSSPNYFLSEIAKPDFHEVYAERTFFFPEYNQSDKPVREQDHAEGHAVRAVYLYCAMADLAGACADEELLDRCKRLWDDMVHRQMYITGSIGSCANYEGFTVDYDLPNDVNYSETCASIGLALFGLRMARITRDASYLDVVERALYNTVRAGISLNGDRYFYVNPLEVWPETCLPHTAKEHVKPVRQKWFDVACCPTNVARTLTSLGQYLYSVESDGTLYLNLFLQNETRLCLHGTEITVRLDCDFPRTGHMTLHVDAAQPVRFPFCLRVPGYAEAYQLKINGEAQAPAIARGFARLDRTWRHDVVEIDFSMRPQFVRAHPKLRADCGKVALVRGPEVFCLEECDNGDNLAALFVSESAAIQECDAPDLCGGSTVLSFPGLRLSEAGWDSHTLYQSGTPVYQPVSLRAVPYACWGNRTPGEMIVWLHAAGAPAPR